MTCSRGKRRRYNGYLLSSYWGNPDSYNEDIAKQAGLTIDPLGTKISTATGGVMNVVGEADICLQYKQHRHCTTVLICSDVSFTILVAWHDLQTLNIISESFPGCLCATQHQPIQEAIASMYPEVFCDSLTEEPMNVPDMHIYLSENAIPYRISTPRQVPLRFQEEAEKTILKLLEAGVIVRVEGTLVCPSFLCAKSRRYKCQDGYGFYQN